MGLTHDSIVIRERQKYSKEWLTFREITYEGYRFDLFAFNPKTKEIEITEVDHAAQTDPKKLKFAESIAKVKVFRNMQDKIAIHDYQDLIKVLANPVRIAIIEVLINEGSRRYSDLCTAIKMLPAVDAGRFAYHLKLLIATNLVTTDQAGSYVCSPKAVKILQFFRELVQ